MGRKFYPFVPGTDKQAATCETNLPSPADVKVYIRDTRQRPGRVYKRGMIILTSKSTPGKRLRAAVKDHLPKQSSAQGVSADEIANAARQHIADLQARRAPAHNPYGDVSRKDAVEISQNVEQLAGGAATDFRSAVASNLRGPQLREALEQTGAAAKAEIAEAAEQRSELKSAYRRQVGKTIAWMAGTAGALVTGGLLPNPVSVLAVGAFSVMTIRSINKARAAQKNLATQLPMLDATLKSSRQVLADTVAYGPHILAWESALSKTQEAPAQAA